MECQSKTPEFQKYRRIPYFSSKVHFYAKQTTESPSDNSETLKTHLNHQNPEFSSDYENMHSYLSFQSIIKYPNF